MRAMPSMLACVALLSGCASAPPPVAPGPAALTTATPAQMLAVVVATGAPADTELAVRPLRDPATAGLRDEAAALQGQGSLDAAAGLLDQALALAPDDPGLLQERAELALLASDFALAERMALQADAAGARVGPLCRRHWATAWQARLALGDRAGAEAARTRIEACRLDRPARY